MIEPMAANTTPGAARNPDTITPPTQTTPTGSKEKAPQGSKRPLRQQTSGHFSPASAESHDNNRCLIQSRFYPSDTRDLAQPTIAKRLLEVGIKCWRPTNLGSTGGLYTPIQQARIHLPRRQGSPHIPRKKSTSNLAPSGRPTLEGSPSAGLVLLESSKP